jgi:N-methylhydantoinase B
VAVEPARDIDPFTIEIVKDSLIAIGDEMFVALQRTSKSPIIYEVLDFGSGLTDADGQLITQGNGVTVFIGTLTHAVRYTLVKFGPDGLEPGDVVMTNDPYTGGGTHLSDVTLVVPVFDGESLIAFAASKAHWTEVGGKDPGSWTTDSTEIFQEGLQLPCVKLYEAGRPVQSMIDVIAANVRLPDMTLGDMHAQAAALRLGERRFHELCAKYGVDVVLGSMAALLDHGERLTRLELAELPKGTFEAENMIDDDGLGHGPFPVRVRITISDDEFVCDFTGTHPQVPGPGQLHRYRPALRGADALHGRDGPDDSRQRRLLQTDPDHLPARHDLHRRAPGGGVDLLGDAQLRQRPRVEGARACRPDAPAGRTLPLRLRLRDRRPPP